MRYLLVEFLKVAFKIFIKCVHWLFVDSSEKTPWIRLVLFLLAIFELCAIAVVGYGLRSRLPIWGFVLAVTLLVFAGAVGFFAIADFYRKKMNPV